MTNRSIWNRRPTAASATVAALRRILFPALFLLVLAVPGIADDAVGRAEDTAAAAEPTEAAEPAEPRWKRTAGVAVLVTSGNTDTETLGVELTAERRPEPWGLTVEARFDRAKEDDELTAEHFLAGIRGKRKLGERWQLFAGLQTEQDEFAGLDQRTLLEAGGTLAAIDKPKHTLSFDFGLTWTDEDRVDPEPDSDSVGALLGFADHWKLGENATLDERLVVYPNFDDSDDWRLDYKISLTAALTERLAMKVGYELRYRNRPIGEADDSDSTTKISLVANF